MISSNQFINQVRVLVLESTVKIVPFHKDEQLSSLMPSKMLRTKFAARLIECTAKPMNIDVLTRACAAVELVHTATECEPEPYHKVYKHECL